MIKAKDASVQLMVLRPEMWMIFDDISGVFEERGYDCILTCGTNAHGEDDPHTHGFALDFRSKHIHTHAEKIQMHDELERELNVKHANFYTVLLENVGLPNEHFHIQVKKGLWRDLI